MIVMMHPTDTEHDAVTWHACRCPVCHRHLGSIALPSGVTTARGRFQCRTCKGWRIVTIDAARESLPPVVRLHP